VGRADQTGWAPRQRGRAVQLHNPAAPPPRSVSSVSASGSPSNRRTSLSRSIAAVGRRRPGRGVGPDRGAERSVDDQQNPAPSRAARASSSAANGRPVALATSPDHQLRPTDRHAGAVPERPGAQGERQRAAVRATRPGTAPARAASGTPGPQPRRAPPSRPAPTCRPAVQREPATSDHSLDVAVSSVVDHQGGTVETAGRAGRPARRRVAGARRPPDVAGVGRQATHRLRHRPFTLTQSVSRASGRHVGHRPQKLSKRAAAPPADDGVGVRRPAQRVGHGRRDLVAVKLRPRFVSWDAWRPHACRPADPRSQHGNNRSGPTPARTRLANVAPSGHSAGVCKGGRREEYRISRPSGGFR